MNDFDYDAMQKKRVARGAMHRVCGSKSKKCSLPSDNLTLAQQKKLSGECKSWNLAEPMSYATFKSMPEDLQVQYVKGLNSRFSVGFASISKDLFGASPTMVRTHFMRRDIKVDIAGKRLNAEERKVWEYWLAGDRQTEEPAEVEEEQDICEELSEEIAPVVEAAPADFGMGAISVEWSGEFNATAFIAQLTKLPLPDGRVKIHLEVVKE